MVDTQFVMNRRKYIYASVLLIALLFALLNLRLITSLQFTTNNLNTRGPNGQFLVWGTFKSASASADGAKLRSSEPQETDSDGTGDPASISRDEVNLVAQELWCPLCSGVRLDVCELQACEQMREEIAIQLAQGADNEEIKAYFLVQYGPQILGEPPRAGFNLLAWIVPFVALLCVGIYLYISRRPQPIAADSAIVETDGSGLSDSPSGNASLDTNPHGNENRPTLGNSADDLPADVRTDYEQLLDQELEKYE